jgi:hypothetical protein
VSAEEEAQEKQKEEAGVAHVAAPNVAALSLF